MIYRRYQSASGRSTSYAKNDRGERYRDMSSPGGSRYKEYKRRSRTPSKDRNGRDSQGNQRFDRRDASNGRKPEGTYRVKSLAVEEAEPNNDEYKTSLKQL